MSGLISDQLLNNLRNVAYRQLVTPVTIQRHVTVASDADTTRTWSTLSTTTGWLVGKNQKTLDSTAKRAVVENDYELRLRQGTDCRGGDRVVIDGSSYSVIDVNSEVTISLFLKASLQRVE